MCIYTKRPKHENVIRLYCRNLGSKNAEETLTGKVLYNWLEAVYLKQVVPPGLLVPCFKILHSL